MPAPFVPFYMENIGFLFPISTYICQDGLREFKDLGIEELREFLVLSKLAGALRE